jgi:hypothetical protein
MAIAENGHFLKAPWVVAQHIKARLGDHGLNRIGDAIVVRLRTASEPAPGGIARGKYRAAAHTMRSKWPVALPVDQWVALGQARQQGQ